MKSQSRNYFIDFIPKSWVLFTQKYSLAFFKNDLLAGITVGIVALPLAMAFAIASGVDPEKGLITLIIAGFLISLLGGSRFQIGGPSGAFVVIIYEIIQRVGYESLVVSTLIAGVILLIAAFSRMGKLIKYIPYPLIIGFTTGIGVIIFSSQIKDFFGLQIDHLPVDFIPKWIAIIAAFPTLQMPSFLLSIGLLILIIVSRKYLPIIPWAIVAVVVGTLITSIFHLPVDTIQSRFGEIPRTFSFSFPHISFSFAKIPEWIPDALTIAFLAGIEALLSAMIADGMTGTSHKPNAELMGQGFANIASVLFGGIPATGAIARTATNIKSGAKTPLAGMIHAVVVFCFILGLAPLVSQIPLAAMSAILMMVAWNMSELHHFRHLFKAPKSDIVILLTTFLLTVFVALTVAVAVGLVLALFLFMQQMAGLTKTEKTDGKKIPVPQKIPARTEIYEVNGPFFFGVADSLKNILRNLEYRPKTFILRMDQVPYIDASGMYALKEFARECRKEGTTLLLTEVKPKVYKSLKKFELTKTIGEAHFFPDLKSALDSL